MFYLDITPRFLSVEELYKKVLWEDFLSELVYEFCLTVKKTDKI